MFGIFSDSTNNRLYINANYIRAGTIDATQVTLSNSYGGFCCARGNDGIRYTYGSMMYGSDPNNYVIATNGGTRMTAGGNDIFCHCEWVLFQRGNGERFRPQNQEQHHL